MTACSFCRILGGAALLLAGLVARAGAQSPSPSSPAPSVQTSSATVSVTYQVADLVVPIRAAGAKPKGKKGLAKWEDCSTFTRQMLETQLLNMIQGTIAPATWNREGATLDYRAQTASLIVSQVPEVQKKVAELLDNLHRQRAMKVALELRLVALPAHAIEPLAKKYHLNQSYGPAQLDDDHVRRFLQSCQGYRACTVTQLPPTQFSNGYTSRIQVPNPVAAKKVEGEPGEPNLHILVQPVASADGRTVNVTMRVSRPNEVQQLPGALFASQYFDRRFAVKAGVTTVLAGWTAKDSDGEPKYVALLVTPRVTVTKEKEERRTACTPCCPTPTQAVLGSCVAAAIDVQRQAQVKELLTQFNRMYREGKYGEAEACALRACALIPNNAMTMAALSLARRMPRLMTCASIKAASSEEQESGACCESKCCGPKDPKVVELVAKYRQACIKGDRAEATRLAVQALALDPACFCKCGSATDK